MAKKKADEAVAEETAEVAVVEFDEERLEALKGDIADAEAKVVQGKAMLALVEPRVEHLKGVVDSIKDASTTEKQVARLEEAENMVGVLFDAPAVEEPAAE